MVRQTQPRDPARGSGASGAGATLVADGVWMYQLTDKGVALSFAVKSTKYSKDDDLNKP